MCGEASLGVGGVWGRQALITLLCQPRPGLSRYQCPTDAMTQQDGPRNTWGWSCCVDKLPLTWQDAPGFRPHQRWLVQRQGVLDGLGILRAPSTAECGVDRCEVAQPRASLSLRSLSYQTPSLGAGMGGDSRWDQAGPGGDTGGPHGRCPHRHSQAGVWTQVYCRGRSPSGG